MNTGTKIRTIVAIVAAINIILIIFGVFDFNLFYKIASVIIMFASWFASHYFNNDYSIEHAEQTGLARLRKKNRNNIIGEDFFDYIEDMFDDEEEDDLNA
jgi:hypothetical protein